MIFKFHRDRVCGSPCPPQSVAWVTRCITIHYLLKECMEFAVFFFHSLTSATGLTDAMSLKITRQELSSA